MAGGAGVLLRSAESLATWSNKTPIYYCGNTSLEAPTCLSCSIAARPSLAALNQRPRKTLGFQTPAARLQASVASTV